MCSAFRAHGGGVVLTVSRCAARVTPWWSWWVSRPGCGHGGARAGAGCSAGAGGHEVAGQAEAAEQRPQVRRPEAVAGDGGMRGRGDGVERVMQRRAGRPGSAGRAPPIAPSWRIAKQRISSARERRRRSQPRTVPGGTPRSAPIRAWPAPPSAAASAVPITSIASARRGVHHDGSTMCVRPQDRQRARSGRSRAVAPAGNRMTRSRPCPHRFSRPVPQDGQASSPPARSAEAAAASAHSSTAGLPDHDGHDARIRALHARGNWCCSLPGPALSRNPDR